MKNPRTLTAREVRAIRSRRAFQEGRMTTARKVEEIVGSALLFALFALMLFV